MLTPHFRELTEAECREMLRRHHVGRLAFTFHDRVDIEPIGFVFDGQSIVFRTSPGSKLLTIQHHPWVALEIDEATGMFDWKSVVVHGTAYRLSETGTAAEVGAYHAAISSLRTAMPGTFTPADPAPFRSAVLQLHIDVVTGRGAATK